MSTGAVEPVHNYDSPNRERWNKVLTALTKRRTVRWFRKQPWVTVAGHEWLLETDRTIAGESGSVIGCELRWDWGNTNSYHLVVRNGQGYVIHQQSGAQLEELFNTALDSSAQSENEISEAALDGLERLSKK